MEARIDGRGVVEFAGTRVVSTLVSSSRGREKLTLDTLDTLDMDTRDKEDRSGMVFSSC